MKWTPSEGTEDSDMSQKMERPDSRAVKAVIGEVTALYNTMSNIPGSDKPIIQAVAQEADRLHRDSALEEMALIDVEILNADKQGIRISALKNAGIKNMSQLHGMPVGRITSINGIGEQSAYKIKEIADRIYRAVIGSAKIQISLKKMTPQQDMLLRNLYILRNGEEAILQVLGLLSREQNIANALQQAKTSSGLFRWLFSSGSKKDSSVQAYQYLKDLLYGAFGHEALLCITAYNDIVKQSISEIYTDFEKNAAAYYTLLENLGLGKSKTPA
jgi:hypothetical protein